MAKDIASLHLVLRNAGRADKLERADKDRNNIARRPWYRVKANYAVSDTAACDCNSIEVF
jgi:hypothetical protein